MRKIFRLWIKNEPNEVKTYQKPEEDADLLQKARCCSSFACGVTVVAGAAPADLPLGEPAVVAAGACCW